jgi:dienelactone hydrolase
MASIARPTMVPQSPGRRDLGAMSPARPLRGYHVDSDRSPWVTAGIILLIVASMALPITYAVYRYRTSVASSSTASTSGASSTSIGASGTAATASTAPGATAASTPAPIVPFTGTPAPIFPERPKPQATADADVEVYPMEITGQGRGLPMHVQLYLPKGTHAAHSLPCVFIAPAGTRLIYGSALTEGDTPEHLPYAHAGFAVMAYELSGDFPSKSPFVRYAYLRDSVQKFMAADGGVANAKWAIDYVLAKVPEVNPEHLYAAGHSSAGTVALNLAAADPRIRGVAAYAPACDVYATWREELKFMAGVEPGIYKFVHEVSPEEHVKDIHCPLFLFYADDDEGQSNQDIRHYAKHVESVGGTVKVTRVHTGGHYRSMIDEGIPDGIAWFKELEAASSPSTQE